MSVPPEQLVTRLQCGWPYSHEIDPLDVELFTRKKPKDVFWRVFIKLASWTVMKMCWSLWKGKSQGNHEHTKNALWANFSRPDAKNTHHSYWAKIYQTVQITHSFSQYGNSISQFSNSRKQVGDPDFEFWLCSGCMKLKTFSFFN